MPFLFSAEHRLEQKEAYIEGTGFFMKSKVPVFEQNGGNNHA